jgi:hypothetical protein
LRLVRSLGVINQAFQQLRKDPDVTLFGFDQVNHLYVHETTQRSIRSVWEQLVQLRSSGMTTAPIPAAQLPLEFIPPIVGPSEDIA